MGSQPQNSEMSRVLGESRAGWEVEGLEIVIVELRRRF